MFSIKLMPVLFASIISSAPLLANDVKVLLSEDPHYNKIFLQGVDDVQKPGSVTSDGKLTGLFELSYNSKVTNPVEFSANSPILWGQVTLIGGGSEYLLQRGRFHFSDSTVWEIPGPFSLKVYSLTVAKRDANYLGVCGALSGAISDSPMQEGEYLSFPYRSTFSTVPVGEFYWPNGARGRCLTIQGNDLAWNFSLSDVAAISKFVAPSRQGCQLTIPPSTGISATPAAVNFSELSSASRLPIFKYWYTSNNNLNGYEFSADQMSQRGNALVIHDPSTNSCMCLSLNKPTGNLQDSCYECSCQ